MPAESKLPSPDDLRKIDIQNEKELTRLQQRYRNQANGKYTVKAHTNKIKNLMKNVQQLQTERRELKSNLTVATGSTHVQLYEHHMKTLEHHLSCQGQIQLAVSATRTQINQISMQLKRLDIERFKVTRGAMSNQKFDENLRKAQKTRESLENRVDVAKKAENLGSAENCRLRGIISHMMYERELFNKLWQKMITQLAYDKKFLIDMVERAVLAFNQRADLCGKLDTLHEKANRDKKAQINEMLDIIRKLDADERIREFLGNKGATRKLRELESREVKRRGKFKVQTADQLLLYTEILRKIKIFSGSETVKDAAEKFNKRDNEYFAHFNYMNSLSSHIEYLNGALKLICYEIDLKKEQNAQIQENNDRRLVVAQNHDGMHRTELETLETELAGRNSYLQGLLEKMDELFSILRCDNTTLKKLLGDNSHVTIFNVEKFLAILEARLNTVLSYNYYSERHESREPHIVHELEFDNSEPHPVEDVVLVHQCPECGEGEDVNRYDEEIVYPLEEEQILDKVRNKTQAPEIQFRLHTISNCHLPRSRTIVNKRYQ